MQQELTFLLFFKLNFTEEELNQSNGSKYTRTYLNKKSKIFDISLCTRSKQTQHLSNC